MSTTTLDKEVEAIEKKAAEIRNKKAEAERRAVEALRDRRKAWAADVIDAAASDFEAAAQATDTARAAFTQAVAHGAWQDVIGAYFDWEKQYRRMHAQERRVNRAIDYLGRLTFNDTPVPTVHSSYAPPPFMEALSVAIDGALPAIRKEVSDELQAELAAVDAG
jgi:hypothetical protein